MPKDFWRNSTVAVLGGGNWGTVLAQLIAQNVREVRLWVRAEERARVINATRANPDYAKGLQLHGAITAYSDVNRIFEGHPPVVIWGLPSSSCRSVAKELAHYFRGDEVLIHATKGIEEGSMKRVTEILSEELPVMRLGVVSGPNLADEVIRGEPAGTVVASRYDEVRETGQVLLNNRRFRVYGSTDVVGVEWAGTLKNVLAIASGALDGLGFGWNTRALLITRGLIEMVRFGREMGAELETYLGLAGMGDLLATCGSSTSRNYRVGYSIAKGEKLDDVIKRLGSVAEGVRTTRSVYAFAEERGIQMPLTQAVYELLRGEVEARQILDGLLLREVGESELD